MLDNKLHDFLTQHYGKSVESEDPTNPNQCFDLAFAWVDELEIPRDTIRHLRAMEIFEHPNPDTAQYFELIENTADNVPQAGDIVVFNTTVGVSGHVCIALGVGDTNTFVSLDQNWNNKQFCRLVTHEYLGVLGWLRPLNQLEETPALRLELNTYGLDQANKESVQVVYDTWNAVAKEGKYIPKEEFAELQTKLSECENKPVDQPSLTTLPLEEKNKILNTTEQLHKEPISLYKSLLQLLGLHTS